MSPGPIQDLESSRRLRPCKTIFAAILPLRAAKECIMLCVSDARVASTVHCQQAGLTGLSRLEILEL